MRVPNGYTEEQVLAIIETIVNKLAYSYKFGYYDVDDIKQEGRILAIEVLNKEVFDNTRPLENFLYTHLRNRYSTLKRDKFSRLQSPCPSCPFFDPNNLKSCHGNQCSAFADKMECTKWAIWINRNAAKRNLVEPLDISNINGENEKNMESRDSIGNGVELKEITEVINAKLDVKLRADYLRMKSGVKLPKHRASKVKKAVLAILEEYNA